MAIVFDEVTARIDEPREAPVDREGPDELGEEQEPDAATLCRQLARLDYRKSRLCAD